MPHDIMRLVWDRACRITGDASMPLRAASCLKPHSLHTLGYCLQAAGTLDEACRIIHRRFHVISTAAALNVEVSGSSYRLVSVSEPTVNDEGFEMFMAFILELFTLLSPQEITPQKITVRRSFTSRTACDKYKSFFRCPVEFDAPENSITFPAA